MKLRKLFWFLLVAGIGVANVEAAETCMIMKGQPVKDKYAAEFEGKTYRFCCQSCVKAFKRNPRKFLNS